MAPSSRRSLEYDGQPVPAAVLVLMYPAKEGIGVALIKRNEYDGHHSAQVSFPGGAWEDGDSDLLGTAIRETREELGITGNLEILGSLSQLHIPVSNYLVNPFVAWMEEPPVFHPDPSEVHYVIEASLDELLDPAFRGTELLHQEGVAMKVPFYRVGGDKVWGATAMMLSEFLQLASRLQ